MKYCPQCRTGFPQALENCPVHGIFLSEIIDLKPGMTIRGTYRIVRKLGEGGMGSVYLATHLLMDEPRAIKFLARQWAGDEGFVDRFRREARTLRQVRHQNVVDSGDLEIAEDASLFFAMEFVDGPDLRDFIDSAPKPFPVGMALQLVRGIACGLGAAHAKGMVHRDVKPENILMAHEMDDGQKSWTPKIADFGIVAVKESSKTRTRTSASLLTWEYAAPEQWLGMRSAELDGRADLYALGGMLFEMLTGRTAFDAESYEGWAQEHKTAAPPAPSSLRPEIRQWHGLDALVLRLLEKDRENRPAGIAAFLQELDAITLDSGAAVSRRVTLCETPAPKPDPLSPPDQFTVALPPSRPDRQSEPPQDLRPADPLQGNTQSQTLPRLLDQAPAKPEQTAAAEPARELVFGEPFDPERHIRITSGLWIKKESKWIFLGLLLALVAVAGVIVYSVLSSSNNNSAPAATAPAQTGQSTPPPSQALAPPSLRGVVNDITGAPIAGAQVTYFYPHGSSIQTTTDAAGAFKYSGVTLVQGFAKLEVTQLGFSKTVCTRVPLRDGRVTRLKIQMQVGSESSTISLASCQ